MTTGDIANQLADIYGSQVSKDLVSRVTDAVVANMSEWQSRPLDPVCPVQLLNALYVRIRDGEVANRPVYVAWVSPSWEAAMCWAVDRAHRGEGYGTGTCSSGRIHAASCG